MGYYRCALLTSAKKYRRCRVVPRFEKNPNCQTNLFSVIRVHALDHNILGKSDTTSSAAFGLCNEHYQPLHSPYIFLLANPTTDNIFLTVWAVFGMSPNQCKRVWLPVSVYQCHCWEFFTNLNFVRLFYGTMSSDNAWSVNYLAMHQ